MDHSNTLRRCAIALAAVKSGFTSSARVVTAAALIMFAVFAAFVPEGDASLKPIALGGTGGADVRAAGRRAARGRDAPVTNVLR